MSEKTYREKNLQFTVWLGAQTYSWFIEYLNRYKGNKSDKFRNFLVALKEFGLVEPQDELNPTKEQFMKNIQRDDNYNIKDTHGDPAIPCNYGVWNKKKQVIECAKDFSKKGKIYEVSLLSCRKCFERRQWVKKQRKSISRDMQETASGKIYCPDLTNWVFLSDCEKCREKTPKRYAACQVNKKDYRNARTRM